MSLLSSAGDQEVMAEINITPFTDVLLVLLIIFMILAALVTPPGFQKNLPDKSDNSPVMQLKKNDNIEVLVSEKGVIFIDNKKTDTAHIYSDLAEVKRRRGNKHISLTADIKAPYQAVITVLDAARLNGLNDVGFVTS
jgi:biopolymer transport protein TolR